MAQKTVLLFSVLAIAFTSSCTGVTVRNAARAQAQSYEAQGSLVAQRLEFVRQYQNCIAEAENDNQMVEACDSYLRSAEALS
ncbi:hypothetical protein KBY24_14600 [Ruegeria pomeroyi]|nr:hypothetical protein [Ruegeria pomeroyi]MCE8534620.1 hypothetical protein [Ruegeria pomeroyi]